MYIYSEVSYMALLLKHTTLFSSSLGRRFRTIRASARKSFHIRRISPIVLGKTFTKGGGAFYKIRPSGLWKQMRLRDSGAVYLVDSDLHFRWCDSLSCRPWVENARTILRTWFRPRPGARDGMRLSRVPHGREWRSAQPPLSIIPDKRREK